MASDDRPVYIRLRDVIAEAILEGRYRDGDPLPSVRALAAEHGANPLTVAKAYQSFQDDGLVIVRRGVGCSWRKGHRPSCAARPANASSTTNGHVCALRSSGWT